MRIVEMEDGGYGLQCMAISRHDRRYIFSMDYAGTANSVFRWENGGFKQVKVPKTIATIARNAIRNHPRNVAKFGQSEFSSDLRRMRVGRHLGVHQLDE